jgi:hypothetical protein
MPNWCENTLRVTGHITEIEKFKISVQSDDRWLDFEKVISNQKSKENLKNIWDNMPQKEKNIYINFEVFWFNKEGYDWNNTNWGTKWNPDTPEPEQVGDDSIVSLYYAFATAWSPSLKVTRELIKQYPKLYFNHTFEEWGMCFAGVLEGKHGTITQEENWTINVVECPKCEQVVTKKAFDKEYKCQDCDITFTDKDITNNYD